MIDNQELPIGFTMELAQHSDVLNHFSSLSKSEQQSIIEKARSVQSHEEMRQFVESIFKWYPCGITFSLSQILQISITVPSQEPCIVIVKQSDKLFYIDEVFLFHFHSAGTQDRSLRPSFINIEWIDIL